MRKKSVANIIAAEQVFLHEYAMFEVSAKGIEGGLINDDVTELSSCFQWIAKQQQIKPDYLKFLGTYEVIPYSGELIGEGTELTEEDLKKLGIIE